LVGPGADVQEEYKKVQEFQLKASSRYKKIEGKSVEAKTSSIRHGSWEVGMKTSSQRVKIECALVVI
jgi:hypothetical protein